MTHRLLLIMAWLLLSNSAYASQATDIDSQLQQLRTALADDPELVVNQSAQLIAQHKTHLLPQQSGELYYLSAQALADTDQEQQAIEHFRLSLAFLENSSPLLAAKSANSLASLHWSKGAFQSALVMLKHALNQAFRAGDQSFIAQIHNNIGVILRNLGDYEEALNHYEHALRIREGLGNSTKIASTLNNIGALLFYMEQYERAAKTLNRSIALYSAANMPEELADPLNNLGMVYEELGDLERAEEHYRQSLQIDLNAQQQRGISLSYMRLASVKILQGDRASAQDYLESAEKRVARLDDAYLRAQLEMYRGKFSAASGDMPAAVEHLEIAVGIARDIGAQTLLSEIYQSLAESQVKAADYEEAVKILRKQQTLQHQMFDERVENRIALFQANVEFAQRQNELTLLRQQSRIQELELQQSHQLRNVLFLGAVTFAVLGIGALLSLRLKQRSERRLAEQNAELTTLDQIVQAINAEKDLNTILKLILSETMRFVPDLQCAKIMLKDNRGEQFDVAMQLGCAQECHNWRLTADETIRSLEQLALQQNVWSLHELAPDMMPLFQRDPSQPAQHVVMLLILDGALEGFLVLRHKRGQQSFSAAQLRRLSRFHTHIVSALGKARYTAQLLSRKEATEKQLADVNETCETLTQLANQDALTELLNRRGMELYFSRHHLPSNDRRRQEALILLDLDLFKNINDRFGHDCGDHVLKQLAAIIRQQVRTEDPVCRWGGEEFLIMLQDCDAQQAQRVASKIHHAVANAKLAYKEKALHITASLGVGMILPGQPISDSIKLVDQALYRAKNRGRNQICIAQDGKTPDYSI